MRNRDLQINPGRSLFLLNRSAQDKYDRQDAKTPRKAAKRNSLEFFLGVFLGVLARRSYFFSWPMGLTLLRLLLLPLFAWTLLSKTYSSWLPVTLFSIMAATDALDGYVARRLHQTSQLGVILDPLADKLMIACSLVLLAIPRVSPSGFEVPISIIVGVYLKDLLVALGAVALRAAAGHVKIAPGIFGKLSTFSQLSLILVTLLSAQFARLDASLAIWTVQALWWIVLLLAAATGIEYAFEAMRQYAQFRGWNSRTSPQSA